jgi:membrane protease YdiL (CAAX protease family)
LKAILFDSHRRLRNGWWIVLFIAVFLLSRLAYKPLAQELKGADVPESWLEPLRILFILFVTWVCTRLRREPLSSVGLRLGRRWAAEGGLGALLGSAAILVIVGLIWAVGGVRLELDPARTAGTLVYGLYLFSCVALFEEILFRGFVFQRLIDGAGVWFGQLALALLFASAHWGNPGMDGPTQVIGMLDLALGAVLFGFAYLRTRSLALPVGLHLGWNWAQGHLLGFGASGVDYSGWFRPVFLGLPEWLSGGEFGPESSVFAVVVDVVMIVGLWKWRGTTAARQPVPNRQLVEPMQVVEAQPPARLA